MPAIFNRAGYATFRTCKIGNSYDAANRLFQIILKWIVGIGAEGQFVGQVKTHRFAEFATGLIRRDVENAQSNDLGQIRIFVANPRDNRGQ